MEMFILKYEQNKQNMVNISTDMWESEMPGISELKQTQCQCCLKPRFITKNE